MSVSIGVCKYIPEREEELRTLKHKLQMTPYQHDRIGFLFDERSDESEELAKNDPTGLTGYSASNLWIELDFGYFKKEISIREKLMNDQNIFPEESKRIRDSLQQMSKCFPEAVGPTLRFFEWVVEKNLVVFGN